MIVRIIAGCLVGLIAVLSGVYALFAARGKGPILSNTWLLLHKEARRGADKRAEYRLAAVVFGDISAIFALLALYIFTAWSGAYLLMWIFAITLLVYVIGEASKRETRSRK